MGLFRFAATHRFESQLSGRAKVFEPVPTVAQQQVSRLTTTQPTPATDMGPPISVSPLALPSPLYPDGSNSSGSSITIPKQSPKKILKSMVTRAKFILGLPQDSSACRRRMTTREEHATLPDSDPPTSSTTRSQPYGRPIRTTSTAEQAESRASSEYLAIHTLFDAGSSMSINSLAHFVKQAAPGFFKLTSSTTPTSFHNDAESLIEEALTEQATIALPCPVPPRGPSLLNLRILEAGLASRVRRPLFSDIDDDTMSLVTHHTNLIPTTFEIGIATAVRLYRPPPVRLIVVHGRVVAMDPPVNAPWDTRSGGKDGCTGRSHFWSKLKRKFRCA